MQASWQVWLMNKWMGAWVWEDPAQLWTQSRG